MLDELKVVGDKEKLKPTDKPKQGGNKIVAALPDAVLQLTCVTVRSP